MHIFLLFCLFTIQWVSAEIEEKIYFGPPQHVFEVGDDSFLLDGHEFNIYAGEIHYFRIPPCKWRDRLIKLRNAGLNTVSTAVEWATHEPNEGEFYWSDEADFVKFVKLAYELDLFVIVRAGPYIGVDRELGGLPTWLHHTTGSFRQTSDIDGHETADYRASANHWLSHLLSKISDMMVGQGGPVIMVQMDSDIGESGDCSTTEWLYSVFLSYLGKDAVLFTMEENDIAKLACGTVRGVVPGIRITPQKYIVAYGKSTSRLFFNLYKVLKFGPKLVELRTGLPWNWGGQRLTFEFNDFFDMMSDIITSKSSFILYMFAGGTNFNRPGFMGNDTDGMITSYDYDGALDEAGDPTKKYAKIQEILGVNGNLSSTIRVGRRALYEPPEFILVGSFLDPETRAAMNVTSFQSKTPMTFGDIGISEGMVVYETSVPKDWKTKNRTVKMHASGVRDRGYVYVGEIFYGIFSRLLHTVVINRPAPSTVLQILVESHGYITHTDWDDQKGIFANVYLESTSLTNWTIHPIPLDDVTNLQNAVSTLKRKKKRKTGHGLYRGTFKVPENLIEPLDTFLHVSSLKKGLVYLNEYSIGRYWTIAGPQQTLYIPSCFIKPYPLRNILLIVEMQKNPAKEVIRPNFTNKRVPKTLKGLSGCCRGQEILSIHILIALLINVIKITYL